MRKRDLKVKHLRAMMTIAKALNVGDAIGKANLELCGPGKLKKAKNLYEWSLDEIKALIEDNCKLRQELVKLKSEQFKEAKEVAIKFDMPCQINEDFKSDDNLLEKAKEPFTKRTENTEVEPALFKNKTMSEISLEDFQKTGLLLLINQLLHSFGMAIVIKYHDDGPKRMFPARVSYRGFAGKGVREAYQNIGLYLTKNAKQLYIETDDDHDFEPEKTQY